MIAVDLDESRLEKARELGAEVTVNGGQADVPAEIARLTSGRGADLVLEVVGTAATVKTSVLCARKGGAVTLVGNLAPQVEMPLQAIVTRELTLLGSCASRGEYPACIELLSRGEIRVDTMITATASLEEGPNWFERLYLGEPGAMKVILQPSR